MIAFLDSMNTCLTQRRKGAKKYRGNLLFISLRLCAFARDFSRSRLRVSWLLASILVLVGQAIGGEVGDRVVSPHAKLSSLSLFGVRWTEGFWADRFATLEQKSIPAMWELMRDGK